MGDNFQGRGFNQQSTKLQNKSMILKMICTSSNITRIDIAKQTGLSKMSVSNITNELINEGYVTDQAGELKNNNIGRNPISLMPDSRIHIVLGIYISRDFAVGILSNLKCEILYRIQCSYSIEESETTFTEKIKGLVSNLTSSDQVKGKNVLGIGVSCIGPLDLEHGIILEPPNFHKIKSIHIKEFLEKEFGYPVVLNNDMNASALAEKLYGSGRKYSDFVYFGVTNGIGSGIITNNAIFQGSLGFSGEVGHITIDFNGPKCSCGNAGCLELYASIPKIVEQAKNSISLGMVSSLTDYVTIEWKDIVAEALSGDNFSLKLIDMLCFYISIALISIINLYDPQIIYLGHDLAIADDLAAKKLEAYIADKTISHGYKQVPIAISTFKNEAPIIGSAALVLDRLFHILQ